MSDFGEAQREVVYGEDDRQDWYAHPSPELRTLTQESIVALVQAGDMDVSDPENIRFTTGSLGQSYSLCRTERFWDQPSAGYCSGTLIDDDLVLTAGHCVENMRDCRNLRYVFNYYMTDATTLQTITSDDVYECRDLVVQTLTNDGLDYAIVQLDRPVSLPHVPAPVRLVDEPLGEGDQVTVIGFGSGIPAKIDTGGRVVDARPNFLDYFTATTDTFGGNSGSGAFNSDGELIGILVRGVTDYVPDGFCFVVNELPENGGGQAEALVYPARAIEALCASGFESTRLCGGGGLSWCDACVDSEECMDGWSCRAPGENPEARTCVPSCRTQEDCRVDHACVNDFCQPAIQTDICHEGDVWGNDVCGNRQTITDRCTEEESCEDARCIPDVVLPEADLSVSAEDLIIRPSIVTLGDSVEFVFTIRNVGGQAFAEPIRVQITAGLRGGPMQVIETVDLANASVAPGGRITQPFTWSPNLAGDWVMGVNLLVDDFSASNNEAQSTFSVLENNVNVPPSIDSLELTEVGDGDGFFEEGEQFRVDWSASDDGLVEFATATFAGRTERLTEPSAVFDVPPAGSYTFVLSATDNNVPPATSAPNSIDWTAWVARPSVVSTIPERGAQGISAESSLSAVFDVPLDPASISDDDLTVSFGAQNIDGSVFYDQERRTLRWTSASSLPTGVVVTATLRGVTDVKGDTLEAPFTWTFTTADEDALRPPQFRLPTENTLIRGTVDVIGTVRDSRLLGHTLNALPDNLDLITLAGPSPDPIEDGLVFSWDTTTVGDGGWTLVWQALYDDNTSLQDTVRVTVDNTPPTIEDITQNPADITTSLSSVLDIRADVQDAVSGVNPTEVSVIYSISGEDIPTRATMRLDVSGFWVVAIQRDWAQLGGRSFSYRIVAEDEAGNRSESSELQETIEATNTLPVLEPLPTVIVTENERAESALNLDAYLSDGDTPLDALRISLEFDRSEVTIFLEADRSLTITPARGQLGVAEATVIVRDPQGGTARGALRIDVRPDREAPTPNPTRWAQVPRTLGEDAVTMRAEVATDPNGVEYFFEETSGEPGGEDSEWQSSPEYTDRGLIAGRTYTYRVRTRDQSRGNNVGEWADPQRVTVPGSCDQCTLGSLECDGDTVLICQTDDFQCAVWSPVTTCQGRDRCEAGQCVPACEDECPDAGTIACEDETSSLVCGQFDTDACLEWGGREECDERDVCTPREGCVPRCPPDELEPNQQDQPAWIARGWYRDLGLCGEEDWYQIDVPTSHIVEFGIYGEEANRPVRALLFNADSGEELDSAQSEAGLIELEARVFTNTRVYVRVWSDGEETERYDLRVDLIPFQRDTCTLPEARECLTPTTFRICGDLAGDGQLQWSEEASCARWETCVGDGVCTPIDPPGDPVGPDDRLPPEDPEVPLPEEAPFVARDVSTCSTARSTSSLPASSLIWGVGVGLACIALRRRRSP